MYVALWSAVVAVLLSATGCGSGSNSGKKSKKNCQATEDTAYVPKTPVSVMTFETDHANVREVR